MHDGPDGVGPTGQGRLRTIGENCDDCACRLRRRKRTGDGRNGSARRTDGAGVRKRRLESCVLTSDMHDGPDGLGQTGEGRLRTIHANCDDCARRLRWPGAGDDVVGE